MKKLLLALFLVFTLPLSAEEQPAVPTADEQAAALINAQEWFRLEACYPEIRDELSPFVRLLCEASLGSHFNRLPESCNAIGTLLNDYQQELFADPEGSMLGWLLSMLIGNLQELGAYEQAGRPAHPVRCRTERGREGFDPGDPTVVPNHGPTSAHVAHETRRRNPAAADRRKRNGQKPAGRHGQKGP